MFEKDELKNVIKEALENVKAITIIPNQPITKVYVTYGVHVIYQVELTIIYGHVHSVDGSISVHQITEINKKLLEIATRSNEV